MESSIFNRCRAYILERFPLHTVGVGVLLCYWLSYHLFGHMAGIQTWSLLTITSLSSFLLFFFQLRLVDDLDDIRHEDIPHERARSRRVWLSIAVASNSAVILLLNLRNDAFWLVVSILCLMLFTPFVLNRLLRSPDAVEPLTTGRPLTDAVTALFYEGLILLIVLYVYITWRQITGVTLGWLNTLSVVVVPWGVYEVWKFSRYLSRPDWRPYALSWNRVRAFLLVLLLLMLTTQIYIGQVLEAASGYFIYVTAVYLISSLYLVVSNPIDGEERDSKSRKYAGIYYMLAVTLGVAFLV